jgi:K+/H+ antiporter YhaU regulatory subunit KhtT
MEYACIREECGCSVIGINANGSLVINPYPEATFPQGSEMILIGSVVPKEKFFESAGQENEEE